jgi:hypothetical protein
MTLWSRPRRAERRRDREVRALGADLAALLLAPPTPEVLARAAELRDRLAEIRAEQDPQASALAALGPGPGPGPGPESAPPAVPRVVALPSRASVRPPTIRRRLRPARVGDRALSDAEVIAAFDPWGVRHHYGHHYGR